ncbi:hypothetical protein AJ85_05695 [Alkalihalobacillus alcalophilus ATCC 27647 = CGMCC 1.3604]|uniref:Phage head morphogenesis domain-containing protein n=1 Tax=Alkalihalobacillus alcalophilus ATCC 27647 = CGMCC 1.3604 TaxID=1218173 RepID=A0A094WGI6_ALKAL|nr:hypothetical protein [Alkalihalobacillus alcalophilus]YP_009276833.1 head morphogenesis [Bacillus phage BalMu-1]AJA42405.1 hypothetical protein BalMu1_B27 [Bacillus phage BalMu-1]AJA42461.1 hypothetical protein BalMu1_A27 [Bacillus phage BalMu-1]KGA96859.1 hypothetical protein BALCAV_0213655 [Alkalihalobacillus alcalophilus ATCC 27647 = CGMCC 1.3604]MED1561148.1 retron-type reverse transcriptase [Alkalihalobacillus alcalophilus]THG91316.1 hypothetical protein AJ85_05695 [Alkalihalobacillus
MNDEIKRLKEAAGAYGRWALEARKSYIDLRLRQDPEIVQMYVALVKRINVELGGMNLPSSPSRREQMLYELGQSIRREVARFGAEYEALLLNYMSEGVVIGTSYTKAVTESLFAKAGVNLDTNRMFATVNRQALEASFARTTKGLQLSDRIWQQTDKANRHINTIIREGIGLGYNVNKVAAALEQYVLSDAKTLVSDYPELVNRLGNRVPGKLSYEALRLARTEMTAAYGEGTIAAGQVAPSYKGVQWLLSLSHPSPDICDVMAEHDEGLGKGVYGKGNEPLFPAHPNCICSLVQVHEEPDDFVDRLADWVNNPESDAGLETWYKDVYSDLVA